MLSQSRITLATNDFLETLNKISTQIITHYFTPETSTKTYKKRQHLTDLYTFVYDNCTSKPNYDQKMFETFKTALLKHLIKYMRLLNDSLQANTVILCFNIIWESYLAYLKLLSSRVFSYLNRYYVPANDFESLVKVGLAVFMKTFLAESNIKVFVSPFAKGLEEMRQTKTINNDSLLAFSQSFYILDNANLFRILKQIYFMEADSYYKKVFEQNCNKQPIAYLNQIANLRYFELLLSHKSICLIKQEQEALCQLFNAQLIKKYTHIFVNHPHGFRFLIKNRKVEHLKVVCQLYEKNQGFAELKPILHDFIIEQANLELLEKSKSQNSVDFVNALYEFYRSYEKVITAGFSRSSEMIVTFNNAFEKILTKFDRTVEDLFKFARTNLDQGKLESVCETISVLFSHFPFKDEFIGLYRRSLESKILSDSMIYLIEKNFIEMLTKICDNEATSDLTKILDDAIESSPKIISTLSDTFNAKVVNLQLWEKHYKDQLSINLTFNEPIASMWMEYEREYVKLHPKRRLTLLPIETKLMLRVISSRRETTLKCNLLQASIILYIANKKQVSQTSMIQDLNIQKQMLQRFVDEFPFLINQTQAGTLCYNWNYQSPDYIIDLDTKIEREKKVIKHITQDRDILIQFTIVRIVKRKKRVTFEELSAQVLKEIRMFKSNDSMVKDGVEALKKKEVVEEDQEAMICYKE